MIDDVYTCGSTKKARPHHDTKGNPVFLSQLNYSYVLLKYGSIQETTGSESLNTFLPHDSKPLQYCYFVSMYLCDCVIDSDRIRDTRPYIPVTSIKLLDRSRYPIWKSLFRVNVDCPTDNAAGCRDVSWLSNSMTPDCTHWVVKPDLLNFQASNENFERGINENKIYLPALWICEKSKSGEPTRIDWRLNGSLRNRTSSKDWNLSNFIPSSL